MSETPDQKKPARPSLYEHRETASASAFSVLGGISPVGWTKQKVILTSLSSFVLGSLLGGSVVGLTQNSNSSMESAQSSLSPVVMQKSAPVVVAPSSATSEVKVAEQPKVIPHVNPPSTNPLASFNEEPASGKAQQNVDESIRNAEAQKKLEARRHAHALAKAKAEKIKAEKEAEDEKVKIDQLVKEKSEKAKLEKLKADKAKSAAKAKKEPSHDKDVMLVKSLLDTMDKPAAKPKVVAKKVTPPDPEPK